MKSLQKNETGAALVTAILVLMLASALMAGMFAALMATQRTHATDRDQSVAYAAAHAGLEKLTAGLAALFTTDFSPSAAQIAVVDSTPPNIPGFVYTAPGGAANSGYDITFTPDPGPGANTGNPLAFPNTDITTGPFEGFKGLITPYTLTVTARSLTGNSEVRLRRELQTVAVPVFQFGIFGEKSLGFHAGPNFDFGGRVHTNESLFLAAGGSLGSPATLTFRDKITAFTQVVRTHLSNGRPVTATGHPGNVSIPTIIGGAAGTYRLLGHGLNSQPVENSGTVDAPCLNPTAPNGRCWTGWKNLSEVVYRTNIRTEATGAKELRLPLTSQGATPIDLIRRPVVLSNENTANPAVFGQRYFAQASLRILLSDRASDITGLPAITAGAPLQLDGAGPAGYVVAAGRPPVALSPGNETVALATGASWTRVSAIAGGPLPAASTFTVQTFNGAVWANGVPTWLKWTATTITASGVPFTCTGLTGAQLSGCGAHAALAVGNRITFTRPNEPPFDVEVSAAAAINSATINIRQVGGAAFNTARLFTGTRAFFAGEDVITCTGFTATTLTGCTSNTDPDVDANDPLYTGATTAAGTPLLNGFIKIEKQNAAGVWSDVTLELLNLGFAGPNMQGDPCPDPTPNAVIRLMRLRDNAYPADSCSTAGAAAATTYHNSLNPLDFWPNTLFDAREGSSRELPTTAGMNAGGLFTYVALDVSNFRRWVNGDFGGTGTQVLNNNGYIIYFSDRRGDHNESDPTTPDIETGEYGNEDSINPAAQVWAKNNVLDAGENFNESRDPVTNVETLETYGETPHALAVPAGAVANMQFDAAQRPWTSIDLNYSGRGRLARPVLFRRALKLINGGIVGGINPMPASGLTVASENPVYVFGDYNATAASVTAEPNIPAAIIGDSITLLSSAFRDSMTFQYPNEMTNRNAVTTGYRFAMITGKTIPFPKPAAWGVEELGSDGGVHNFMKMLEDWSGQTLRYRGSMVSLYYSRQAIGIYRADANVYGAPTRGYNFDTDFLSPPLLPPGTPMFRDINTLKFRQILRPNQ